MGKILTILAGVIIVINAVMLFRFIQYANTGERHLEFMFCGNDDACFRVEAICKFDKTRFVRCVPTTSPNL